jgi:hypothetical protein
VAGDALRPSRLVSRLEIDKSLASRLARGMRSESPFELVHFIPSPAGLRIFLDAAERAGVDGDLCKQARRAVRDFQNLLDELPGGRSALDSLISESVVEVRHRSERAAKQAVYRAMSTLLGFHCETVSSALILQPSADGSTVDGIDVSRREGIRRLRPSTPGAVFSIAITGGEGTRGTGPELEALESGRSPLDPRSFLLPGFCTPSPPAIDVFEEDRHTVFALSNASASVQSPVTITSGVVVRDGWKRFKTGDQAEDGRSYLLQYPCKLLIRDLFIRDDLYVGAEPQIRLEFPNPTGPPKPRSSNLPASLNTLDLSAPIQQLGLGLANAAAPGVPLHTPLLAHAFETLGWDSGRFRGYRTRIVYPVPMVVMGWWVPLPAKS